MQVSKRAEPSGPGRNRGKADRGSAGGRGRVSEQNHLHFQSDYQTVDCSYDLTEESGPSQIFSGNFLSET